MKYFLMITLSMIIFSCQKNEERIFEELKNPPKNLSIENKYTLELQDSIFPKLFDDISANTYTYKLYQDSLFYFIYNTNKLAVLNTNSEHITKIPIEDYQIKGDVTAIEVISKDSILLAQNIPSSALYLVKLRDSLSIEKKLLSKVDFEVANNDFYNSEDEYDTNFNIDYNNLIYDKKYHKLHIGFTPIDADDSPGFENAHRIGLYDWELGDWEKTYAPPEGLYKYRGERSFGRSDLSRKQFIVINDTTYINYRINHKISYFSDGLYKGEFAYSSSKSKQIKTPLTMKESDDFERTRAYLTSTPHYPFLFYHSKLKLFSRIYLDEQEVFNINGLYNRHSDRDAYIVFLNKKFEYVGEYKFKAKQFSYYIAPTSDGLLMFSNQYNDTDDKDLYFKLKYKYIIKPM